MIAANVPQEPDDSRGQGQSVTILSPEDEKRHQADIRLAARAVKWRWPVPEDSKSVIIERLLTVVKKEAVAVMTKEGPAELDGPADSNAIAAARVLVAMEGQNQSDEQHDKGETVNHRHSGSVGLVELRQEILNDPRYLEYARERIDTSLGDTGGVCVVGEQGQVEAGPAPENTGPGDNGHANGNGGH